MSLRVIDPGLFTLVVDQGRPATRSLGVPVGGAADRLSLALGNALVGNRDNAAALEITLAGPTLQTDTSLAAVVYGAPFVIDGSQHTGSTGLRVGTTFTLLPGETLTIGGTHAGMRAYLCVRGGIPAQEILRSRSSLGPLNAGQQLACDASTIQARFLPDSVGQTFVAADEQDSPISLRVVTGAQADWFQSGVLFEQEFEVTPASNRMGLRLRGSPLTPAPAPNGQQAGIREMTSEPVAPGAVQVTRDGQCIILGVDGQTIGGYPKIAHVIAADLDRVGQIRPGRRLRFAEVSLEDAANLHRARQRELAGWLTRLETSLGS
jgi:antagonist of KipI